MSSSFFSELISKAEQLTHLNHIVHQKLDPALSKHCRVANVREGILILTTSSPHYGHLLRFSAIELLSELRAFPEWCHLKSIKTHVRPPLLEQPRVDIVFSKPCLSIENAVLIQGTASQIHSPRLQKALLRLSKHTP